MKAAIWETGYRKLILTLAWLLALLLMAPTAQAATTVTWIVTTGSWSSPYNWSPHLPADTDDVQIINDTGSPWLVLYLNLDGDTQIFNSLTLDATTTGSAVTLSQSDSSVPLSILQSLSETIGDSGSGTHTQGNGTNTVTNGLILGNQSGSSGTYDLSNSGSLTADNEIIGNSGLGAFTQSGGFNVVTGTGGLTLGYASGGSGTYNLSGTGSLSISSFEIIGYSGTGAFTQSGGTHNNSFFILGVQAGSSGSYDLQSGSLLDSSYEIIGDYGIGVFTQSGGTNTITNYLTLGIESGSSGTYELTSGSLTADNEIIGNSGLGVFTQSGGTNAVSNTLTLASVSGSSGTYNLTGGSLSATTIQINSGGHFNVTGGTQTVTGNITNAGHVKTTDTDVTWNGTFTNNGVYMSDPATQTFSDLTVGTGGYIVAGAGDVFKVSNNFVNNSTQNSQWNTNGATLQFTGTLSTNHNLSITGPDNGPTGGPGDFSWATLKIDDQIISLLGDSDAALYVEVITGVNVTNHPGFAYNIYGTTSVLNIYYDPTQFDNIYLGGLTYDFESGNGQLIPTPLPASVLLLGSGLLGLGLLGRRRKKRS